MTPLITLNDIRSIKSISLNLNSDKELIPHILEAQNFDLRPMLGDTFFIDLESDILASPSLDKYENIWNAFTYDYAGEKFRHEGLKTALIYHTYARYLSGANIQTTATGIVQKLNQYSEKIDDRSIQRLIVQARSAATITEDRVKIYVNRFPSIYPLWKCGNSKNKFSSGLKIRSIG